METEPTQKPVVVRTRLDADQPDLFKDSEQIYQVIFNIVFNAIQAMPHGGDILVQTRVSQDPSTVMLEISDTGVGIPPEKIEQIFTPFYTDKNRGTGLGLTIAKNIVEKHQGSIAVTSLPDEGSTFRVTLPVAPLS
jgi:signal transduction histidine kinase